MKIKPGVRIQGARPELVIGLMVAQEVFLEHGSALTVTSIIDGAHTRGSIHYSGNAADLRIWELKDPNETANALNQALGGDFDVIVEKDHIHLEFQPKLPYTR